LNYQLAIMVFCSCLYLVQSLQIILRFPTVKSLLSTYRYFFKRFLASLCEGNSKDCEFCFLVSVRWFSLILYTVRIFVLWPFTSFKTILRTFSRKIWLADQGERTKFFDFRRLVVYLYAAIFVCSLASKGTHLMKVLLLVFELYNRKKRRKKPENLTSKH
jgi:hypothetical protein